MMQDVDSIQIMHEPKLTNVTTTHAVSVGPKLDTEVTRKKDAGLVDKERGGDPEARDLDKKQVLENIPEEVTTNSLMHS